MKKLESSLKNMLQVLTGVTIIAVGLLAYVNELTKEPIAQANQEILNTSLKEVVPEFDNNPVSEKDTVLLKIDGKDTPFFVYPAKMGDKTVGTAIESSTNGFSGEIKILVGFNTEGNIYNYSVLAQTETPGLGTKMADWFKPKMEKEKSLIEKIFGFEVKSEERKSSIVGLNPARNKLSVSKDGGEIDAITASTITSRAFLFAVNNAYAAYKGETDGVTSATQQTDASTAATIQSDSTETK